MNNYLEYRRILDITYREVKKSLNKDYQSLSELRNDLKSALRAVEKVEKEI